MLNTCRKTFLCFLGSCLIFFGSVYQVFAIENPLGVSNNKFGVHILFPEELGEASDLVNSSSGDWGYVTIPIQSRDKDLLKWQKFMDTAKELHIVPIIRLATENSYFDNKVWRKPNHADVLDFANFLNSLDWPTKNRYVIIFNEPNRFDEWEGIVDPKEYSLILEYAVTVFKSRNQDFFIISAGLDNAADGNPKYFMNQYDFMIEMNKSVHGIFNQVDGLASHSYPNPAFSQPPYVNTSKSIASFKYERELVRKISSKNLPIFITETGWSRENLEDEKIASYFEEAFESVWNDEDIAAVTPFLLRAGMGDFVKFSLIDKDGSKSLRYKALQNIPKEKGNPILPEKKRSPNSTREVIPTRSFTNKKDEVLGIQSTRQMSEITATKTILKWLINP